MPRFRTSFRYFRAGSQTGSALLIVLALMILLVGVVVLFLSRALVERQVSDSSMNQTKAEVLAKNALAIVVGDLKQEIAATSTPTPVGKTTIYEPKYAAGNPAATIMMPIPNGPSTIPNLIRTSTRTDPAALTALGLSTRASPVNSTSDVSANGRSVNIARWNEHYLIPQQNTASQDSTPIADFTTPDWVIVTRGGPQTFSSWNNSLRDATPGNQNFVTGRYAYAIYDEGGLIDVNVAGYPTTVPQPQVSEKGSLAFADLGQLPGPSSLPNGSTIISSLVGWRNYATAQPSGSLSAGYTFSALSATNFFQYVFPAISSAPTNSPPTFLTTNPAASAPSRTDQAFTSRQSLLDFQRATGVSPAVLQYLGTFSRELNQPCYSPRATTLASPSSPASSFNPAPVTYPNANTPIVQEVANPTTGKLLVQQRFALSHLTLFANPTANAAAIQKYFGLTQIDKYTWQYADGASTGINTLAQVALLNRAPDFFETLQAAILSGSLYGYDHTGGGIFIYDPATIIHLGANLINQYQANNFPITIQFSGIHGSQLVSGTDDLPYLSEMLFWPYRPVIAGDSYRSELDGYLQFEFWNPHQNTSTVPGPTQLRLVLTPPAYSAGGAGTFVALNTFSGAPVYSNLALNTKPTYQVVFNNSSTFREPTVLSPAQVVTAGTSSPDWTTVNGSRAGFLCGQFTGANIVPDKDYAVNQGLPSTGLISYNQAAVSGSYFITLELEFQDPSTGNWYPYQGEGSFYQQLTTLLVDTSQNENADVGTSLPAEPANLAYTDPNYYAARSAQLVDPRCVNPGVITGQATPNESVRPLGNPGIQGSRDMPAGYNQTTGVITGYASPPAPGNYPLTPSYPAMYNENVAGSNSDGTPKTYLTDGDGVVRSGDGYLGSSPYVSGATTGRPIILHRPFRSIGEMGYTYRGLDYWKTIDFFTPQSADAGLLDYFSLEDAPMVAGKINLNTRQPPGLQAVLSGAYREESTGDFLTASDAQNLAAAIVAHTATAPLMSRADLVRGLLADPAVTSVIDNIKGTLNATPPDTIKGRREAMVRALADVGTTRTWNLLIDVIAQSGRYAPNATQLGQFTVEGEKHYWLHVAIDRYTGAVIDQQLEYVSE